MTEKVNRDAINDLFPALADRDAYVDKTCSEIPKLEAWQWQR